MEQEVFQLGESCPTLCLSLRSRFSVQLRAVLEEHTVVVVRIACGDGRKICDGP